MPEEFQIEFNDYLLHPNDVVMALTRPILGNKLKVAKLTKEDSPALLNQRVAKLVPQETNQVAYLYYVVQRLNFVTAMNTAMAGTDPPNIGSTALGKIYIAIPRLYEEQRSLAQALSDVDALIAALDKALAKQRHIKTATMQQLLTGKKRLPGFGEGKGYKTSAIGVIPEDWEVSCLDSVTKLSSGTTPSRAQEERYYRGGEYHWVKTTDLNNSRITTTEEKVTKAALDETCLQIYPSGTVLVAMYGGFNQIGRTGLICIPAAVNQALIAIQVKLSKLDPEYLLATLNYQVEHWKSVASSSRKDPNITSQDVRAFVLPLPRPQEQRSIATVLSDMDGAIAAIEARLAKTQAIKQGMMQELLTGRTRLL